MKKDRIEHLTKLVKIGVSTVLSTAVIVGFCANDRRTDGSTIVLSRTPERTASRNTENSDNAGHEKSSETKNNEGSADLSNALPVKDHLTSCNSEKPFIINLNTATSRQLQTLSGIGEAKAAAIIEYREMNGGFSDIYELLNVKGIGEHIFENIRDYITVGNVTSQGSSQFPANTTDTPVVSDNIGIVNINTATLEELQTLPGIGETKAMAIIQYRSVFGGFSNISEIMEVSGIGEKTYENICDYITTGGWFEPSVQPASDEPVLTIVNINTASLEKLKTLPGIGEAKARAIIEYRSEYGGFADIEEIMNVSGIGEKLFDNICEYITVGNYKPPAQVPPAQVPPAQVPPEASDTPAEDPPETPVENPGETPPNAGDDQSSQPEQNAIINLNTATYDELLTLPGIGEDKSAAIIKYRSDHGGFSDIREIMNISGISEKMFAELRDRITV